MVEEDPGPVDAAKNGREYELSLIALCSVLFIHPDLIDVLSVMVYIP